MGNNHGLKLKEPGWFPPTFWVELGIGLRPYIPMIAAPTITVASIITTSVPFAVDKLCEIGDEVLVLASSKREVENTLEID